MEIKTPQILTYGDAATELGTDLRTISGLVRALGITPKPVKYNNLGKGLDAADLQAIRTAFEAGRQAVSA